MLTAISGFRRDADDICTLLGCHAVSSGSSIPTCRDKLSAPFSRVKVTLENGEVMLSRNVGEGVPLDAA
jgi:hypothetical protein